MWAHGLGWVDDDERRSPELLEYLEFHPPSWVLPPPPLGDEGRASGSKLSSRKMQRQSEREN